MSSRKIWIVVMAVVCVMQFASVSSAKISDTKVIDITGAENRPTRTTFDNMILFSNKMTEQWSASLYNLHRFDLKTEHVYQDIIGFSLRYTIDKGESIGLSYSFVETYMTKKADSDRFNFSYGNILHQSKKAVYRGSISYATGTDWESGKQNTLTLTSTLKWPNKMSTTLGYNLTYNHDNDGVSQMRYDVSQRISGDNGITYTLKYTFSQNYGPSDEKDDTVKLSIMIPITK